jgi:bis(5'-nucleosidyl)-tetraphosphatase
MTMGDETNRTAQLRKAGVIILRLAHTGWQCLLLRAYRNWGFAKGEIEPGETPLQAAVREVQEETSLTDLDFCWGEAFIDTPPRPGHKLTRYYVAVSPSGRVFLPVSPELGRPEHHEFRWVGFDAAKTLLGPPLQPIIAWAESIAEIPHSSIRLPRFSPHAGSYNEY